VNLLILQACFQMNNQKHYAAAISAFVIWGFFSIPLRQLREYSAGEILYFRILASLIILIAVVALFRRQSLKRDLILLQTISLRKRMTVIGLTLVGGLLLTVNWLTFIYIVNNINIKTASFAYLICPVITAVLGYVLIQEKMSRLQWIAVGLCTVSCVLIGINSALEIGYSFLTALTYALYLISQRKNQGFDRMVILAVQVAFSLSILTAGIEFLVEDVPVVSSFYWTIFLIAALFTVFPLFLNLFALNRINSATIGILMYINPIFNFTIAFLVFKETISLIQVGGYLIIFIALIIFNYSYLKQFSLSLAGKGSA
jgi:chloramphenicol-sensitive protein RarD